MKKLTTITAAMLLLGGCASLEDFQSLRYNRARNKNSMEWLGFITFAFSESWHYLAESVKQRFFN